MHRATTVFALTAFLVIGACTPRGGDDMADPGAVRQELDARMSAFIDALLAGNAEQALTFFTADARVLQPGMDLSGDPLRQFYTDFFGGGGRVASVELVPYDTFAHGDAAYQVGWYDEVVEVEGEQMTIQNHFFVRWERGDDGVWRMDRFVAGPREAPSEM